MPAPLGRAGTSYGSEASVNRTGRRTRSKRHLSPCEGGLLVKHSQVGFDADGGLGAILDLWSRKIVGWPCGSTVHASLILAALGDAVKRRRPPKGLLHHSDRGSQYVDDYIAALEAAGFERSMRRAGNCYDNAAMESFWASLKSDTGLDASIPAGRGHAKLAVFDYIETFYNPTRRHSSLGQISPCGLRETTSTKRAPRDPERRRQIRRGCGHRRDSLVTLSPIKPGTENLDDLINDG